MSASIAFTVLGFIYSFVVIKNRKRYTTTDIMTTVFYTIMEFTQMLQYYYIGECTQMNYYLTVFVHLLLWIQPLLANFYGFCETKKNQHVFQFAMVMSFVTLVVSFIQLYVGEMCTSCILAENMLNVGNETCTTMGTIHLQWQFKYANMRGFNANWLLFTMLVVLPNWYHSESIWQRPLNWFLPFIVAVFFVGDLNNEVYAIWCAYTIPYGTLLIIRELMRKSQ
jgi:hypothetical protein